MSTLCSGSMEIISKGLFKWRDRIKRKVKQT